MCTLPVCSTPRMLFTVLICPSALQCNGKQTYVTLVPFLEKNTGLFMKVGAVIVRAASGLHVRTGSEVGMPHWPAWLVPRPCACDDVCLG